MEKQPARKGERKKAIRVPFRRRLQLFDDTAKQMYLDTLAKYGRRQEALRVAGVSKTLLAEALEADEDFLEAEIEARETYRDKIEREIERRAIEGWLEPVYQKGVKVGSIRKFSDRLLELHAKRHIPEYRDKVSVDMSENRGGVLAVAPVQSEENWEERYANAKPIEGETVKNEDKISYPIVPGVTR